MTDIPNIDCTEHMDVPRHLDYLDVPPLNLARCQRKLLSAFIPGHHVGQPRAPINSL